MLQPEPATEIGYDWYSGVLGKKQNKKNSNVVHENKTKTKNTILCGLNWGSGSGNM